MKLGIDVSTYFEELEAGVKYYIKGKEVEPLNEFINNGVRYSRITRIARKSRLHHH